MAPLIPHAPHEPRAGLSAHVGEERNAEPLRSPKPHLLTGHLSAFGRDPLGFLTMCAREYGDFVPLRLGPYPSIFINHPDLIEEVFVTHHRSMGRPAWLRRLRSLGGNGLLTADGDVWLRERRLMQPAFHREHIAAYGQTVVTLARQMVDSWPDQEVRDIQDEMMHLALRIAGRTLFGADVAHIADEVSAACTVALEHLQSRLNSLLVLLPDSVPTPANLRFRRAVRRLDQIVYGLIARRRDSPGDDLLTMLLRAQDEDGSTMTDRQLRDEVVTLFIAGHETSALALTWIWYLLATNPEAQSSLVAELAAVLQGRSPTIADLPRLAYTDMIVDEALRLYPPSWSIGREARHDCVIGGHPVRKGTSLFMSQWVMHRDPRFFAEPHRFRPERWANGAGQRLPRFAYFPFGGGPRLCIGRAFAKMEMTLALATIAQQLQLSFAPGTAPAQEVRPQPTITLRPQQRLQMTARRL